MAEYKRELFHYQVFDYEGIESHLEEMARKGWVLDSWESLFMKYRKAEPQELHYSVVYRPKASAYQSTLNNEQVEYDSYMEVSGWKRVVDFNKYYIYVSEEANPVPIETDEMIKLENIHQSMKRAVVLPYIFLIFILLFNATRVNWITDPVYFYSNYLSMVSFIMVAFAVLQLLVGLRGYYRWYRKSKEEESLQSTRSYGRLAQRSSEVGLIVVLLTLISMFVVDRNASSVLVLITVVLILLLSIAYRKFLNYLRERHSKALTQVVGIFVLIVVSVFVVTIQGAILITTDFASPNPDDLPLTMQEIWVTQGKTVGTDAIELENDTQDFEGTYVDIEGDYIQTSTFLLSNMEMWGFWGDDYLSYQVLRPTKGFVRNQVLNYIQNKGAEDGGYYVLTEQGDWTANEVHQAELGTQEYLLIYDDAILLLALPEEPSAETIQLIEKQLVYVD